VSNQPRSMFLRFALAGLVAGCAASTAARADDIPASLQVPPGAVLTQKLHAVGVQIYSCGAGKDGTGRFEWVLKAPEADLSDQAGHKIAKHYAGPTWEAVDGSKVTGEVMARADSPTPNAIAWLLLSAKPASGSGVFAAVRFIQRLHTVGGTAPSEGCNQASAGREVRVPYSAEYRFYLEKT
jgi:hypothetical protein